MFRVKTSQEENYRFYGFWSKCIRQNECVCKKTVLRLIHVIDIMVEKINLLYWFCIIERNLVCDTILYINKNLVRFSLWKKNTHRTVTLLDWCTQERYLFFWFRLIKPFGQYLDCLYKLLTTVFGHLCMGEFIQDWYFVPVDVSTNFIGQSLYRYYKPMTTNSGCLCMRDC